MVSPCWAFFFAGKRHLLILPVSAVSAVHRFGAEEHEVLHLRAG